MIRIIADSSCCISQEEAKQLNIDIIPLGISFGDENYLDGINLSTTEFYQKLINSDIYPTTSQPSPIEYLERFEAAEKAGDDVLLITLSSKISSAYDNAVLCQRDNTWKDHIEVVDSLTTISSMAMLIKEAVKLRDSVDVHQLAEHINKLKLRSRTIASIDTLEYLSKGGRLSGAAKVLGTLLNIKPLIAVIDGEIPNIDKAMGTKNAQEKVFKLVSQYDIDYDYPIVLEYSVYRERVEYAEKRLKEMGIIKNDNYSFSEISGIVGTHIGPGACAVIFFEKEKN